MTSPQRSPLALQLPPQPPLLLPSPIPPAEIGTAGHNNNASAFTYAAAARDADGQLSGQTRGLRDARAYSQPNLPTLDQLKLQELESDDGSPDSKERQRVTVKRESAAQVVPALSPIPKDCDSCAVHVARLRSVETDLLQLVHFMRAHIAPAAIPPSCTAVLAKYSHASDYTGVQQQQQFVSISSPQSARALNKKQRLSSDPNDGRRSFSHGSAHSHSNSPDGMGDDDEAGSNHGGGAGDQTDDESEDMRGACSRRQSISSNMPSTPQSSLYYQTTTADAQTAAAAAAHSSSNPFCKPCPLLSNLSKHPLRVSYVEIPREYTLSKKDAASQLSSEERLQPVRVPIRIMGRPLDPSGEDVHTNSPPALGRIPRSDIWVVSKDICAVLHIRKGNVAKTIAHFEAGSMKASMPVLCQRSNGTVSTHILTVLSIRGVHKLLTSSRSELAPSVSQWVHQQFEQLCGPEDPASLAARLQQSPLLNGESGGSSRKRKQSIPSPAVASQAPPSPMFPALRLPTPIAVSARSVPMPGRQLFSVSSYSQPTSPTRLNRAVSDPLSQAAADGSMEGSRRQASTPGGHRHNGSGSGAGGAAPMQIQSPPQRTLLPPAGHHFPPVHPSAQFRLSSNTSSPSNATLSVPYSHPHGQSMMQQQLQSMHSTPSSALSSSLNTSAHNSSFSSPASTPPTSPYKPAQMHQPQPPQPVHQQNQLFLQVPQMQQPGQPPVLLQSPCPLPSSLSHSPVPSSSTQSMVMQQQQQQHQQQQPPPVSDGTAHNQLFLMMQQQQAMQQQQQQRLQQQHQLQAQQTMQQHAMLQQQQQQQMHQLQQQHQQLQQHRLFTQRQLATSPVDFSLLADTNHALCEENDPM